MDNHHDVPVQTSADNVSHGAQQNMLQEAITKYHVCKDGRVVLDPKDCIKDNNFPELKLNFSA